MWLSKKKVLRGEGLTSENTWCPLIPVRFVRHEQSEKEQDDKEISQQRTGWMIWVLLAISSPLTFTELDVKQEKSFDLRCGMI